MSKKSRRRARLARARQRVTPAQLQDWSAALRPLPALVEEVVKAMRAFAGGWDNFVGRFSVGLMTHGTEWQGAISKAVARADSVPLLAYADWLEERGDGRHVDVRRVAAGMLTTAEVQS